LSTIFITLFFAIGENRIAYGFIFGAAISAINFYIMSLSNLQLLNIQNNKKTILSFINKNLAFRYILYFLALLVSLKHPFFGFSGTLIGLFIVPFTIIVKNFI